MVSAKVHLNGAIKLNRLPAEDSVENELGIYDGVTAEMENGNLIYRQHYFGSKRDSHGI